MPEVEGPRRGRHRFGHIAAPGSPTAIDDSSCPSGRTGPRGHPNCRVTLPKGPLPRAPRATVRYGEHVAITFEGEAWEKLPGASRLTLAQRSAIEAEDPLLCVMAGAGAGKTRVLTLRVARRVRDGSIDADRALVTTFSRKAAEELRTRLWSLGVSGVKAGTFHHTALGLLREHRAQRGAPRAATAPRSAPPPGRCASRATRAGCARSTVRSGGPRRACVTPEHYEAEARRAKRRSGISAPQVADVFIRYEAERIRRKLLDFDDLITACADALAGDAAFADAVRWRTRHLFVDEMQDVNPAQFRLLTALLSDEPTSSWWATPISRCTDSTAPIRRCLYRLPRSSGGPRSSASTRTTGARRRSWRSPRRCSGTARPTRRFWGRSTRPAAAASTAPCRP